MINRRLQLTLSLGVLILLLAGLASGQSSRPRRVKPPAKPAEEPLLRPEAKPSPTARNNPNAPLITVVPVKPIDNPNAVNTSATGGTSHAYQLLQQKQYAAAAKEAKEVATNSPGDAEAWKIAGFAELNLKQYAAAAADLEKAIALQRTAKQEDPNTVDALAQAYFFSEKFEEALPLLVTATTRSGAQPDASMLYYRAQSGHSK